MPTSTVPDLSQERVLVTGGAGFIGCALSRLLAPRVAQFVAMDSLHPQIHARPERPGALHAAAELVVADVCSQESWDRVLARVSPSIIVHLAAETGTGQSLTEASRHGNVNVVGTTQLVDALGRHALRPGHLVLSSSRAVYGEGAWRDADGQLTYPGRRTHAQLARGEWDFPGLTFDPAAAEDTRPLPTSVYGATKLAQEYILGAWSAASGVPLTVFRFQNVFGPGQSLTNSYTGIVTLFCRLARSGQSIPIYEDGAITRDFVFIEDVVHAVCAALERPSEGIRTLDVGSGQQTTVLELGTRIAELYGAPAPHVCGKFRDGDVRRAACSIAPTRVSLGWEPRWTLDAGLRALRIWVDHHLAAG